MWYAHAAEQVVYYDISQKRRIVNTRNSLFKSSHQRFDGASRAQINALLLNYEKSRNYIRGDLCVHCPIIGGLFSNAPDPLRADGMRSEGTELFCPGREAQSDVGCAFQLAWAEHTSSVDASPPDPFPSATASSVPRNAGSRTSGRGGCAARSPRRNAGGTRPACDRCQTRT